MRHLIRSLLFQALAFLALAATGRTAGAGNAPPSVLLLISMDAFRWDYTALHPAETPRLRQLMREGISAKSLIPEYPSNTFPNHYTLVTGLYPAHSGIINNTMFDPVLGAFFNYKQPASAGDSRWWKGEPIWVTAGKQGKPSATSFWVGSEAEIEGLRPTHWKPYDYDIPFEKRLDEVIGWMKLPVAERPAVITFYLEETNSVAHKYGPESPELAQTLRQLDNSVGAILDRVKAEGQELNLIVVSDHGMTECSPDRVVLLDDFIDVSTVQIDFDETAGGLRPLKGDAADVLKALAGMKHAKAYAAADLPPRFHLSGNPRIPPVWIIPDEGWEIMTRAKLASKTATFNKGEHGYDPALVSMHGILIARGPAFKSGGAVVDAVENIHVYNLMCAALGLVPAPNDGDNRLVRAMLR